MTAPPAYQADGKPDPDVVAQLRPEGRLGRRAIAIANSGVPLTLAPGPETLESWTQLANNDPALTPSLSAMRDALSRSQVLAGAYVPIDVRSLVSGGLSAEVGPELVQGTDKLSAARGAGRPQNRDRAPRQRRVAHTAPRRRRRSGDPRRRRPHATTSSSRPRSRSSYATNRAPPPPSDPTPACSASSRATIRRRCAPTIPGRPVRRRARAAEHPAGGGRPRAGRLGASSTPRVRLGRADLRPSPARAAHRRRPDRRGAAGDER